MSDRRKFLLALPAVPMMLSACKVDTINYFPPHPAPIRVLNVLQQAPAIDVTVNTKLAFTGVLYPTASDYQYFDNEKTTFAVSVPGAATSLLEFSFLLAGEQPYTLIVMGTLAVASGGMIQELPGSPTTGQSLIATFNADITYPAVDVYVTAPGVDITTVGANYSIGYNSTSRTVGFDSGSYQVRVTSQGQKTVVYDAGILDLAPNVAAVLIMYSTGSSMLLNAGLLHAQGAWTIVNNLFTRTKVVNAAPGIGAVNQLQGGVAVVTDLAYASASTFPPVAPATNTSSYAIVPVGSDPFISFEATSTPGATIASVTAMLNPGADQTVFITGLPGANQAIVLNDLNSPPSPGNVRLRFVNASPDAGPIDVLVDGTVRVTGLAPQTASGYVELVQGTYTFTFNSTTTGATLLALPGQVFNEAVTTSIFAIGQAIAMSGLVTQDL